MTLLQCISFRLEVVGCKRLCLMRRCPFVAAVPEQLQVEEQQQASRDRRLVGAPAAFLVGLGLLLVAAAVIMAHTRAQRCVRKRGAFQSSYSLVQQDAGGE